MTTDGKTQKQEAAKRTAQAVLLRNREHVRRVAERFQSEGKPISVAAVAKRAKMTPNTTSRHLKALGLFEGKKRRDKSPWEMLTPDLQARLVPLLLEAAKYPRTPLALCVQGQDGKWSIVGKSV